jgi:hypothetical protein
MPLIFLAKIGSFFTNPKTAAFAWGAVLVLAISAYGFWSWNKIGSLETKQTALVERNERLANANTALVNDQIATAKKMQEVSEAVATLNTKYGESVSRRRQAVDRITSPTTPPGEKPDSSAMEVRANSGMNSLFDELEAISKETK